MGLSRDGMPEETSGRVARKTRKLRTRIGWKARKTTHAGTDCNRGTKVGRADSPSIAKLNMISARSRQSRVVHTFSRPKSFASAAETMGAWGETTGAGAEAAWLVPNEIHFPMAMLSAQETRLEQAGGRRSVQDSGREEEEGTSESDEQAGLRPVLIALSAPPIRPGTPGPPYKATLNCVPCIRPSPSTSPTRLQHHLPPPGVHRCHLATIDSPLSRVCQRQPASDIIM